MKTKIRRILSMLMVFCMMAGLMPAMATTAYADDSVINSVALTIPEEAGEYLSGTAINPETGANYISWGIHELYVNGVDQGISVQLKAGDEVRIEMYVRISNDYTFAEKGTATVNGKSATYNRIDNSLVRVTYSFTVGVTATPSINYDSKTFTVEATGYGNVILYVDGEEAPNPYTFKQGEEDKTYVVTATAQEEGKKVSAPAALEVKVPAEECKHPESKVSIKYDATGHWYVCECGKLEKDIKGHTFDNDQDTTCNSCDYTRTVEKPAPTPSKGGGGSTKYKVTLEDTDNGSVESSRTKASKGTTVTITVDPEAGYEVDDIVVETKAGKEVEVTDKGEGKFTFKMPAANVTVSVDFAKAEVEDSDAKEDVEYIQLTIDSVIAWVFDEYVTNDVAPVIRNARTMLPARFVAEALGGVVTWNEEAQKVTIVNGEDTIEIFIGEPFATVNGAPVELDSPAFIENDRTYLPIRFIAENMGATVTWDADARTVTIVPGE